MDRVTQAFADEARRFVGWATGSTDPTPMTASSALHHLVALYAAGLALSNDARVPVPSTDTSREDLTDELGMVAERIAALPVGYYGSLLDPLAVPPGEAGVGDLADDLADVFADVAQGLRSSTAATLTTRCGRGGSRSGPIGASTRRRPSASCTASSPTSSARPPTFADESPRAEPLSLTKVAGLTLRLPPSH